MPCFTFYGGPKQATMGLQRERILVRFSVKVFSSQISSMFHLILGPLLVRLLFKSHGVDFFCLCVFVSLPWAGIISWCRSF